MVSLTTGLTGWIDMTRSFFFPIICAVCVGIIGNFFVGVRVRLTTINIFVVIVIAIRVISGLVLFLFELKALVLIVTWFFAIVVCWFGLFRVLLCGLLRYSLYLELIWGFKTIHF